MFLRWVIWQRKRCCVIPSYSWDSSNVIEVGSKYGAIFSIPDIIATTCSKIWISIISSLKYATHRIHWLGRICTLHKANQPTRDFHKCDEVHLGFLRYLMIDRKNPYWFRWPRIYPCPLVIPHSIAMSRRTCMFKLMCTRCIIYIYMHILFEYYLHLPSITLSSEVVIFATLYLTSKSSLIYLIYLIFNFISDNTYDKNSTAYTRRWWLIYMLPCSPAAPQRQLNRLSEFWTPK